MMKINAMIIGVDGRGITLLRGGLPSSGSENVDVCLFSFSEDWEGLEKSAVFWQHPERRYEFVLDESNLCLIPSEAIAEEGFLFIGIIGRGGNRVLRSKPLIVPLLEGTRGVGKS